MKQDAWNTGDELQFVERLGTHSEQGRMIGTKEMRRRYLMAMKKRANWDKIKSSVVTAAIK